MTQRLKTKTEFRRFLHANALGKLIKFQRDAKSNEARSARAAMRTGWLHHARLLRFVQFKERMALSSMINRAKHVNAECAGRLMGWVTQ